MSLLDEHNDAKASIECARKAIEHIYEEADKQNWQIQNDLREILNQDPAGAYYYLMLITSDEEMKNRFYEDTGIKPSLPLDYELLTERVDELDQLNRAKTKMFNDEHTKYLVLKNCIIRFMKYHPTWKLSDDERKLIFGENN